MNRLEQVYSSKPVEFSLSNVLWTILENGVLKDAGSLFMPLGFGPRWRAAAMYVYCLFYLSAHHGGQYLALAAKQIKRQMGKAIHTHQMIHEGDHLLVAVSGGKDSLSLLWLLRERIVRIPIRYRITAVHVDPGFGTDSAARMASFFSKHGFDFRVIKTRIGLQAHGPDNRENPCFLCSRMRRKLLFELARELGCNRIAFGHHKDDVIETFLLNVFYGASISTMLPVQGFFKGELTVIRPLYLIDEDLIGRYAKAMGWERIELGCPSAGSSKREEIKQVLQGLYLSNRKIKGNIFHALQNVNTDYLL